MSRADIQRRSNAPFLPSMSEPSMIRLCFPFLVSLFAVVAFADERWLVFPGGEGPGAGKHIVLVSGDHEYRSEEALPQLGKILSKHHGFKCTVLFAIDPETGEINPENVTNIPGLEALADADLVIFGLRFRNLEDDQMDKEVNPEFEGTITEVTRLTPAEYNQEFFDKNFGEGKVSSLEEAKEFIREEIGKFYVEQTTNLLHRDIQDSIMEKNSFDLPDTFLKKWLTFADEKNTPEKVEEEYPQYSISVKWSLIREKLEEKFEVKIEESEIREGMAKQISAYMQGMNNPEFIESTVDRLMADQKQVSNMANEIGTKKLFDQIAAAVKLVDQSISIEEFRNIVQERNEKNQ